MKEYTELSKAEERKVKVVGIPTGFLFTMRGDRGLLEALSIGDYGKQYNIKADFLGFNREINGVPNRPMMPLSEKWVITLSTQYGCTQKCTFCDVPKIPFGGNATFSDLKNKLYAAISMFPNVKHTDRLNIHFARMGEPIYNLEVFRFAEWLATYKRDFQKETGLRVEVIHPVLTTSAPVQCKDLSNRLHVWAHMKNNYFNGQAGLQLSINSTDEYQRRTMFNDGACTLERLSETVKDLEPPTSRKYCLNFAYSTDFKIDAKKLANLFNPEMFMAKITPIHNNCACRENSIKTVGGYDSYAPYKKPEEDLKAAGFDVLVFVPSMDEEQGLVTCGNLALSGRQVEIR